jgi:hypothetical protein
LGRSLRAPFDLARIGFGVGHDLGHGFHGQARIDRDNQRRLNQLAHRSKYLDRIVADIGVDDRAGRKRAARGHQDGVAIRRGLRDELAADAAAGTAAIFDDDGLAQYGSESFGDDARHAVCRSSWREGHDDFDRFFGRIGLRVSWIGAVQRPSGT